MSDDWGTMPGERDWEPDEAAYMLYEDGCCPFCGHALCSRQLCDYADESEIYCTECGYVEDIE